MLINIEATTANTGLEIVRNKVRELETALSRRVGEKLVITDVFIDDDYLWVQVDLSLEVSIYFVYNTVDKTDLDSIILVSNSDLISLFTIGLLKTLDNEVSVIEDDGRMVFVFSNPNYSIIKKIVYALRTGLLN